MTNENVDGLRVENDIITFQSKPKLCKTRVIGEGGGVEMLIIDYTFGNLQNIELVER